MSVNIIISFNLIVEVMNQMLYYEWVNVYLCKREKAGVEFGKIRYSWNEAA
jgi:hypothetical protein